MKLYEVYVGASYEGGQTRGIFSSLEKAIEFRNSLRFYDEGYEGVKEREWWDCGDYCSIYEFELDRPLPQEAIWHSKHEIKVD